MKKIEVSNLTLLAEAQMVAEAVHKNQMYDIFPYTKHLIDVVNILKNAGYPIIVLIGAWLHDSIEDGSLTYNKIKRAFGEVVAELVLAVSDPSDVRNRKEKKRIVYEKLDRYPEAKPIKIADRLANVRHSCRMGNKDKYDMYKKEHEEFRLKVYCDDPLIQDSQRELDELMELSVVETG